MFKSVTGNIVGGTFDSINKLTRNGYSLITAIYD